jgi:hypothetical protein
MPVTKGTPRFFIPDVDSSLIGGALGGRAEFLKDRNDQRGRAAVTRIGVSCKDF